MTDSSSLSEKYIQSILGQQTPMEISEDESNGDDDDAFLQLLHVDSLWNLGRGEEAKEFLAKLVIPEQHKYFGQGLHSLLDGNLQDAYDCFSQASNKSKGLLSVFYGERAVNVSLGTVVSRWILCVCKTWYSSTLQLALDYTDRFLDGLRRENVAGR